MAKLATYDMSLVILLENEAKHEESKARILARGSKSAKLFDEKYELALDAAIATGRASALRGVAKGLRDNLESK